MLKANLMTYKGFTMLELLMVIVVVGLLASLAIPQYQGFVEKAKVAEAISIARSIMSAQEVYRIETGGYADSLVRLVQAGLTDPNNDTNRYWGYDVHWFGPDEYGIGVQRNNRGLSGDRWPAWRWFLVNVRSGGIVEYVNSGEYPYAPVGS